MRAFLQRALLIAPLGICTFGTAIAETRQLQFEIEPIIILNCVEQIDYRIDTSQLLLANENFSQALSAVGTPVQSARRIEARFAADRILNETNNSVVEIVIKEACSVRGLGRGEGFLIDVKHADQGLLVNSGSDGALTINDARGKPHYASHFARQFTIPQSRISLDREINLDVQLRVDMRFATGSGRYSSPVDGVFSIEVSAP